MAFSFRSLSRGKQIALCVLGAHGLLFITMLGNYWIDRPLPKQRPIAVRTFSYPAPQPVVKETSVAVKPKGGKKEKVAPAPSKPVAKKAPAKKVDSETLLKEIAKSFDSIAAPAPTPKAEISIPKIEFTMQPEEFHVPIGEQIATFLQTALELPEYGEVKAQLTIDRFGHLTNLEILETKSEKNEQFLKNRLPELQFPCLNESASLTIVFRNAL